MKRYSEIAMMAIITCVFFMTGVVVVESSVLSAVMRTGGRETVERAVREGAEKGVREASEPVATACRRGLSQREQAYRNFVNTVASNEEALDQVSYMKMPCKEG